MKKTLAWVCIVGGIVVTLLGCVDDSKSCKEKGGTMTTSTVFVYNGSGMSPMFISECKIPKENK